MNRNTALVVSTLFWGTVAAGCSGGLSSLESLRREEVRMSLSPDFGQRGKSVTVTADLGPEIQSSLKAGQAYVSQVSFGEGCRLPDRWSLDAEGRLEVVFFIDALAREGERKALIRVTGEKKTWEAKAAFFVVGGAGG
ncbi:MAG: hypothetical protein GYA21_08595 [Myxococcales bacterium]|nr:hypothetical protein [Myxococcales bacterium]